MNSEHCTLRDEYPENLIQSGVRGKYTKRYRKETNIVLIDPDLHKNFQPQRRRHMIARGNRPWKKET